MSPQARRFFGCLLPLAFLVTACGAAMMLGYAGQAVVHVATVANDEMAPVLSAGQTVLTNNTAFWYEAPYRPAIVLVQGPEGRAYRRIVGLPGETIQIKGNQLLADGEVVIRLQGEQAFPDFGPLTVPEGSYFVLAEQPEAADSRQWGPLAPEAIFGVTTFIQRRGSWRAIQAGTPVPTGAPLTATPPPSATRPR
jgi:signal peptidase I